MPIRPGVQDDLLLSLAIERQIDDSGFAPSILLVEPSEPFLGTTRLEALPYRNVDLSRYYPYGNPPLQLEKETERK